MLQEPYTPRPIRCLGLWEHAGWRLKVYGIAYGRSEPANGLVQAARGLMEDVLTRKAAGSNHYHTGFVGVHQGKTGNFVFIDWWADENELHHHVYVSGSERPSTFDYVTPTGLTACAWDLRVLCFERDAWVRHVLQLFPEPDLDGYLADRLDAVV